MSSMMEFGTGHEHIKVMYSDLSEGTNTFHVEMSPGYAPEQMTVFIPTAFDAGAGKTLTIGKTSDVAFYMTSTDCDQSQLTQPTVFSSLGDLSTNWASNGLNVMSPPDDDGKILLTITIPTGTTLTMGEVHFIVRGYRVEPDVYVYQPPTPA